MLYQVMLHWTKMDNKRTKFLQQKLKKDSNADNSAGVYRDSSCVSDV